MAKSIRSRRISVAAGALSLALVAPAVAAPESVQLLPAAVAQTIAQDASSFGTRYSTTNFWNAQTVQVEDLRLNPGDTIAPTGLNTAFRWGVSADEDGVISVTRPGDTLTFNRAQRAGQADIGVRVTPANGSPYNTTLKIKVEDSRTAKDWESQLDSEYTIDFGKSTAAKEVPGLTIPEGATLSKAGAADPGWKLETRDGKVFVTPPASFSEGSKEFSVTVNDDTDKFGATLRINARNPQTPPAQIAGTAAGLLGKVLGGLLGTGGAGGVLGSLLGGIGNLLGGGGGNGGDGGSTGSGAGRLINVVITNNANPTVNIDIRDNGSHNASNNSAVISDNANPLITGNANPTVNVEVKDNGNNNGNPVITGNANPTVNVEVKDNGNPVITGNANPVITGNANPVITDNANSSLGSSNGGGGITSPRCIVALAGLGLPLAALVPIVLAQQVRIPGLEQLAAQAAEVFNNAAAQFNVQPEQITAVGGGAVGAVIALLAAVAVVSCIPGGASPAAPAQPTEKAPVVETKLPA